MRRLSDAWKQKVHPLFTEVAGVYREAVKRSRALGPNPSGEKATKIDEWFQRELEKVRARHANAQYTPTGKDPADIIFVDSGLSAWPPSQREMSQGFLENLYWQRFGEPLWIALQKEDAGDSKALGRVLRVAKDFEDARFGRPIKAAKGDPDHAILFELGLDLGLSTLTPEKLADCFDDVCPCGKIHDADALKKQRSLKQKKIQEARDWLAAEHAKMPTREWMAAYGRHNLYAKGVPSINNAPRRVYVGKFGEPPLCYIDERGDVVEDDGSKFASDSVPLELPHAFGVENSRELFRMFFPEDVRKPKSRKAK